ncbi:MAG: hypothetical protein WBV28_18100 [Terracidiphilus sp.]
MKFPSNMEASLFPVGGPSVVENEAVKPGSASFTASEGEDPDIFALTTCWVMAVEGPGLKTIEKK